MNKYSQGIVNNKKCYNILVSDIILSIFFGATTIFSVNLEKHEASLIAFSSAFFLGTLWAFLFLFIVDNITTPFKKYYKFIIIFKSIIITAFLMILILDLLTLSLTKTHINIFIIESLMHEGFKETSGISDLTYYVGVALLLFCPIVFFIVLYKLQNTIVTRIKTFRYFYLFLILIMLLERLITTYGDYVNNDSVKIMNDSVIWRPESSIRSIKKFRKTISPLIDYEIAPGILPVSLKINISPLSENNPQLPDIIFIMADGLRSDMLRVDTMPYLSQAQGTVFNNHYSNSNCTHFGVFSVLFGLFPNYYANAVDVSAKPTLVELADDLGYVTHAMSSNNFNWFGMNKLISLDNFDHISIFNNPAYDFSMRDHELVNSFKKSYTHNTQAKFYYIALNSTHHNYYYPDTSEFKIFIPAISKNSNLFSIDYENKANQVLNRYKNSVLYTDHLVKEISDHIKSSNKWHNTIFIVFGDHGEEFYEEGHSLHANYLNFYQTSAALFIHAPGDSSHKSINVTSSHIDILPTVINIIKPYGINLIKPEWLRGQDLLSVSLDKERLVFSANAAARKPIKFASHHGKKVCNMNRYIFEEQDCELIIKKSKASFIQVTDINH